MGIDINRVIAVTFVLGAGLGAVASVLFGTYYGIAQYDGLGPRAEGVLRRGARRDRQHSGRDARRRAARCGRGARRRLHRRLHRCLPGRAACGVRRRRHFILFGSNYQDVFAFLVLILVLVFRPQGLLGERVGDRA